MEEAVRNRALRTPFEEADARPDGLARFVRIGGLAAVFGGGLRVFAAFVPWRSESLPHEWLALVIDIGLLLGLAALAIAFGPRLGRLGGTGLGLALLGVASIVGPDAVAFGVDFYELGVATVGVGMAMLGIAGLRAGLTPRWAFGCWVAAPLLSASAGFVGRGEAGFIAAGVAFGAGFVGTGRALGPLATRSFATALGASVLSGALFLPLLLSPASLSPPPGGAQENRTMDLNQVTLAALDLDRSVDFYRRFGLKLIVYSPENRYARFEIPGGNSTLSLHVEPEVPGAASAHIYFESADPGARVADLAERGIEPVEALEEKPWLWTEAWFEDPAGNRIAIYAAGENRKNPPWRLRDDPS